MIKKEEDLISVIVPVYNVEEYLERCLDSIVNQTYSNLEIILVNDGSTDTSGEICDRYTQMDNRIIVIHQINKGSSGARNAGLNVARGKYICFVDSDDYIEYKLYEILYKSIQLANCDMAILEVRNSVLNEHEIINMNIVYNQFETVNYIITMLNNAAWNKLISRDLIKDTRFYEGKTHGEDLDFLSRIFKNLNSAVVVHFDGYHYEKREGSITTSKLKDSSFDEVFYKDRVVFLLRKEFPDSAKYCEKYCFTARLHLIRKIIKSNNQVRYSKYLTDYKIYILENYRKISGKLNLKEKGLYYLLKFNLYR